MSVTVEKHECFVGLKYVAEHGLPGYPPPVNPFATHGRKARPTTKEVSADYGEAEDA